MIKFKPFSVALTLSLTCGCALPVVPMEHETPAAPDAAPAAPQQAPDVEPQAVAPPAPTAAPEAGVPATEPPPAVDAGAPEGWAVVAVDNLGIPQLPLGCSATNNPEGNRGIGQSCQPILDPQTRAHYGYLPPAWLCCGPAGDQ